VHDVTEAKLHRVQQLGGVVDVCLAERLAAQTEHDDDAKRDAG